MFPLCTIGGGAGRGEEQNGHNLLMHSELYDLWLRTKLECGQREKGEKWLLLIHTDLM